MIDSIDNVVDTFQAIVWSLPEQDFRVRNDGNAKDKRNYSKHLHCDAKKLELRSSKKYFVCLH